MAGTEFLNNSKFFFEIEGLDLLVQSVSGLGINITTAAQSSAVGVTADNKTQTEITPGICTYNDITVVCVATKEVKGAYDNFREIHAQGYAGGASSGRESGKGRRTAKLAISDGKEQTAAEFQFEDMMPVSYSTSEFSISGGSTQVLETITYKFIHMKREK